MVNFVRPGVVNLNRPALVNLNRPKVVNFTGASNPGVKNNRSPGLAIRKDNWKLLMNKEGTAVELYDIAKDKNETINLAAVRGEIVKELSIKLMAWWNGLPK